MISAAILRVSICELTVRVMKFASCPFPEMAAVSRNGRPFLEMSNHVQKWPGIFRNGRRFQKWPGIFRNCCPFSELKWKWPGNGFVAVHYISKLIYKFRIR